MSASITGARQGLRQAQTQIKQGNVAAAVQAIQTALTVMRGSLMKSERTELSDLVAGVVDALKYDPLIKQIFPMELAYIAGGEIILADTLKELQGALATHVHEQAEEAKRLAEEKKRATFERGKTELSEGQESKGKHTFQLLKREFPQDVDLMGNMGQALLQYKCYEEAVEYLSEALDLRDDMLPLYNSIGIALRALGRFDTAEVYYLRASKYLRNDPNLYFNIARLYLEWGRLPKAKQAVSVALKLNPDFMEGQKLLRHLEKKIEAKEAAS